jgi:hypothetical protein
LFSREKANVISGSPPRDIGRHRDRLEALCINAVTIGLAADKKTASKVAISRPFTVTSLVSSQFNMPATWRRALQPAEKPVRDRLSVYSKQRANPAYAIAVRACV